MSAKPIKPGFSYLVSGFGHSETIYAPDAFAAICTFLDRFSTPKE